MKTLDFAEQLLDCIKGICDDKSDSDIYVESGFKIYNINSISCGVTRKDAKHIIVIRVGEPTKVQKT